VPPSLYILLILVPGFLAGILVMDSVRKVFSDDAGLLRKLFEEQPVTMIAAATTIGSVLVWAVLEALRVF
jgi:hypothetical protein